mmetsp:Transcript_5352/g.8260  ORF Transcript_5352/g.8260 Transcript_5352/m.8260 type:complete len:101 (+) Transcript_5352:621-923(+)
MDFKTQAQGYRRGIKSVNIKLVKNTGNTEAFKQCHNKVYFKNLRINHRFGRYVHLNHLRRFELNIDRVARQIDPMGLFSLGKDGSISMRKDLPLVPPCKK